MSQMSIVIPSFPLSPPESPFKVLESPEWFQPPQKHAVRPTPVRGLICPLAIPLDTPPLSPSSSVNTPPLSPTASVSSSEESESDAPSTPRRPRGTRSFHTHRRTSAPSYFPDASTLNQLPTKPKPNHQHRARFASMPVSGMITPMWSIDEEAASPVASESSSSSEDDWELRTPSTSDDELPDPFKMLLPFCKPAVHIPTYSLNESDFVLAHVPARRLTLAHFKPHVPSVPRWQRPILMATLCVMLFGSMCMVSWFQQSALSTQKTSLLRQTVWLAKASAQVQSEAETHVDLEPGYKPVLPVHHSLKVQGRLAVRQEINPVSLEMTKEEELAALLSFVTGTTANSLPPTDASEPIEPDVLLPFDPRSAGAKAELAELVKTQWENFPILVLGKLRDPQMVALRRAMKKYIIKPAPQFVDIDQRADAAVLEPTLQRLIGKQDHPYVLLQGKSLDVTKIKSLENDDEVVDILAKSGAAVAKKLKKNKHAKEEERRENDRVLGPRAIADE